MVTHPVRKSIAASSLLTIVMFLFLTTFVMAGNLPHPIRLWASTAWTLFLTAITFLIYRTGRISRYRTIFFVIYAAAFLLSFIANLIEERGSMALTQEIIDANETPLCPVAIPQLILPAALKHTLIFPTGVISGGRYGGFLPILALWLVAVLALGRGWCSWGCFYGGIDEGFSKILRRPVVPTRRLHPRWRLVPFAILFMIVIWAFLAMEPVYCEWLCPLKLVTEYPEINSLVTYLQAVIFITLGMGLLVILPILTGKRTHCGLFCPLGACQSLLSPINPYRVMIDREKCIGCGKCKEVCPTFSITDESLREGKVTLTCTRCGRCIETCPQGAIHLGFVGAPCPDGHLTLFSGVMRPEPSRLKRILKAPVRLLVEILEARTLFIFGALLFGAVLSSGFVTDALVRLWSLATEGTFLLK